MTGSYAINSWRWPASVTSGQWKAPVRLVLAERVVRPHRARHALQGLGQPGQTVRAGKGQRDLTA